MTQEALKLALEAITQYLAESPDPSEEAVEGLWDAAYMAHKALAQPEQPVAGYCKKIEALIIERDNLKEALAQHDSVQAKPEPEQEPVAWPCLICEADFSENTVTLTMQCTDYKVSAGKHWLSTTPPQRTEQEVVAWMDADGNVSDNNDHKCFPIPLYTIPPQRTWVGLDEVEIIGCTCECIDEGEFNMDCAIDFARAIEAKLKEKNL